MPMIIADIGDTKPDAGVIATSPATAPEAAPTVEGLPVCAHDIRAQVTAAMPVAICVATNALVAFVAAAAAEPALKPNQPEVIWMTVPPAKSSDPRQPVHPKPQYPGFIP